MSRHAFKLLVIVNQILLFTAMIVGELNDEFPTSVSESVFHSSSMPPLSDVLYWLGIAILIIGLVAAIGLCFEQRWARTLFVATFAAAVLSTAPTELYVTSGWTASVSYLAATTEGMIIALCYFSPVKRMFASHAESEGSY